MKIYILEKPGKCLDQMLDWLTEDTDVSGIYAFENDIQFIEQLGNNIPEICIIRAGWGGLHGLRVAEMVKQTSPNSKIIILSETKDYAIEAFEVGAYGYLLCPLDKNKFKNMISTRRHSSL